MFKSAFEKICKEIIVGGLADGKPDSSFEKKDLKKGMKVEKEHTKSKAVAKEIAKDHLSEDKKYYEKLEKIEKKAAAKKHLNIDKILKHLHKYRRDYLLGVGTGAAVSSAISQKKRENVK